MRQGVNALRSAEHLSNLQGKRGQIHPAGNHAGTFAEGNVSQRRAANTQGGQVDLGKCILNCGYLGGLQVMQLKILSHGQMQRRSGRKLACKVRNRTPLLTGQRAAQHKNPLDPQAVLRLRKQPVEPHQARVGGYGPADIITFSVGPGNLLWHQSDHPDTNFEL
jgi:hypothetical protein